MTIITVDLASKFSAVCVRERAGQVLLEFDSRDQTHFEFAARVARLAQEHDVEAVIIEDVPYGISSQAMVKPVLRLQGILITMLNKILDRVYFVNPSSWQRSFPGVARGKAEDRIEAARVAALQLGYEPPDLIAQYIEGLPEGYKVLKKHTNPLAKNMTDYIDAFLISEWAYNVAGLDKLASISGVQPVLI